MDFGVKLLIALGLTCAIGIPIYVIKFNRYRKDKKSVKYLEFKVAIIVGLPIVSMPILLSDDISILTKIIMVLAWIITM